MYNRAHASDLRARKLLKPGETQIGLNLAIQVNY
jgi:hypothetical protein